MDLVAPLLHTTGLYGAFALGLPLGLLGLRLRAGALTQHAALCRLRVELRPIAALCAPGSVAIRGVATPLGGGRWLLSARDGRAIVELPSDWQLPPGEQVVSGIATHVVSLSRGYRDEARVWVIDARGDGGRVVAGSLAVGAHRLLAQAIVGGLLFASGLAAVALGTLLALGPSPAGG